jgi:hypothetical protein
MIACNLSLLTTSFDKWETQKERTFFSVDSTFAFWHEMIRRKKADEILQLTSGEPADRSTAPGRNFVYDGSQ